LIVVWVGVSALMNNQYIGNKATIVVTIKTIHDTTRCHVQRRGAGAAPTEIACAIVYLPTQLKSPLRCIPASALR
jgi:hypothetical protein